MSMATTSPISFLRRLGRNSPLQFFLITATAVFHVLSPVNSQERSAALEGIGVLPLIKHQSLQILPRSRVPGFALRQKTPGLFEDPRNQLELPSQDSFLTLF